MKAEFKRDGYFKIDPETHLVGDISTIGYFPAFKMWWKAAMFAGRALNFGIPSQYVEGLEAHELESNADPEALLSTMNKYGVDICCLLPESMMETTGYSSRWVSNGEMARVVDSHPERFLYEPNLSPIKHRGVRNALWELEYWAKERGAKIFKFYPPEDTYINDPELWPFYEKAQELEIVLAIHTGFSWVPPGKSKYGMPYLLDDVARDFPELKLVAFHMGYPHCDDLNMVGMGHANVHLCLSLLVPWALCAPLKFARILGEALRFVGPDRIVWGIDYIGIAAHMKWAVDGLRDFQIPKDMQEGYGYPKITDEDRRKIFGGNLGNLLGIDTSKRRVKE
jgi:predicted TIM-barrel fold metal-dependent hydrolase